MAPALIERRIVRKLPLSSLAVAALTLSLPLPAAAEHNMEHVYETTQSLKDAYLPPGYGSETGIINAYDPISGYVRPIGLHGTAYFCQNYGGYYFDGGDGYLYWWSCA
jgi:hypothetical protein